MMQRRELDFRDFDSLLNDVAQLQERGYTKLGNWDLGQICEHLTKVMRGSMNGYGFQGPWFIRTFLSGILRWYILSRRRMPAGAKGPAQVMPAGGGDVSDAVKAFNTMVAEVRDFPGPFQPSPFLGQMTPEQYRQFHLIHAAHHLSFLIPNDGA